MAEASATLVVITEDKENTVEVCQSISSELTNLEIIVVTEENEMQQDNVQSALLFIVMIDDETIDPMSFINQVEKSPLLSVVAFSNKDYDVVTGMELGYSDVVPNNNHEHLLWVTRRELSRISYGKKFSESRSSSYSDFTGVHSRLEFLECVQTLEEELHQPHSAILYVQLDNFSWINENLGMLAGDHFLKDIGYLLKSILKEDDFVARYQGGNFIIFVAAEDKKLLSSKADMIRESILEHSTEFQDNLISSSASIGARLFEPEIPVPDQIANAYDASDLAKSGGGDAIHYYREQQDDSIESLNQKNWDDRIKQAFDKDQFLLYFQPIVNIQSDSNPRYEVLLRMQDEEKAIIAPGTFLPYAERAGLMSDIDRKVIVHSLEKIVEHRKETNEEPELFIKLSGKSVDDVNMASWISNTLKDYDYPAEKIVFEITESIALHHLVQTRSITSKLSEIGTKVAIAHFGTRFRSFKLIESLAIDYLKIDGSIVQHLASNKGHQTIMKKIVKKAKTKDVQLIAEAVQEASNLPLIWQYEIPLVQGFFLGVPTEEMTYDFRNLLI